MSGYMGEANPHQEIDDLEKQLFVMEFERLAPLITLTTVGTDELLELPPHNEAEGDIVIVKQGRFRFNEAIVALTVTETIDEWADETEEVDDHKIWSATVTRAPITSNGITVILSDFYRVEYIEDDWDADFERQTVSSGEDSKPPTRRTNQEIEWAEFMAADPTEGEHQARKRQIAEEMAVSLSEAPRSVRFTKQRYHEVMDVLEELKPEHVLAEVYKRSSGSRS